MQLDYKLNKIKLLILASICLIISVSAKSDNLKISYVPSDLVIVQSEEFFEIENEGSSISLPKITKQLIEKDWIVNLFTPNIDGLQEDSENKRNNLSEIISLSNTLGIKINFEYLDLYKEVISWLGTKYKWAGSSRKGIDCSGFTNFIYKSVFNRTIDRNSVLLAKHLQQELPINQLQPGDLVFFATNRKRKNNINHVGIYLGQGSFAHASVKGVKVSDLTQGFYAQTFIKAGRI